MMDNNKFAIYSMINNNKILCSTNTIYPNVPVFNCPDIKLAIGNNNTKVLHRIRVCYYIDADYNCKCETIEEIGCGKSYQEALINAVEKAKIREKEVIEKKSYKGPFNYYQEHFSCNKERCNICVETVTVTATWESCKHDFSVTCDATATSSGITCKIAKDKAWRRAYDEAYNNAYLKGLKIEKEKEKEKEKEHCNLGYLINDYGSNNKIYCVKNHESECFDNTSSPCSNSEHQNINNEINNTNSNDSHHDNSNSNNDEEINSICSESVGSKSKCNCHNKCKEKKYTCKDDVIPLYQAHDSNLIVEQEQNIHVNIM